MSSTLDLFAEEAILELPDRVGLIGQLHGARLIQLDFPKRTVRAKLSPLGNPRVEGYVAHTEDDLAFAVVGRATSAKLGVPETLVVPDITSVRAIEEGLKHGRGHWNSPRPVPAQKIDLEDAKAKVSNVIASWQDRFKFLEQRDGNSRGLRPPQAGALHAVMAHWSVSVRPATIVMPTGTGKTETMLSLLVSRQLPRLLVVVPNDALRSQIADKFMRLGVLAASGCITNGAHMPVVAMMKAIPRTVDQVDDIFLRANVIVCTMQIAAGAPVECQDRMAELASNIFVDEAHHIPARTWNAFKSRCSQRPILQFTATPFRNDQRSVGGKFIYVYPLRKAQQDGLFKPISFVPVHGLDERETDDIIIERVGEALARDLSRGLNHAAMARVDSIDRAVDLHGRYAARLPAHNPLLVHSKMKKTERDEALRKLRAGESRLIVCVDMLGEGFDFPELKIAGLHDKHKSEAITLQFVGRFTRARQDLGDATVVANVAQGEVRETLRKLYADDADWDHVLSVVGTTRTLWEERRASILEGFTQEIEGFPLQTMMPRMSAVVYRMKRDSWTPYEAGTAFKSGAVVEGPIVNESERLAVFVTRHEDQLRWATLKDPRNIEFNLYLVHWDEDRGLLFINSSRMQELHTPVARAVGGEDIERITGEEVFRVLSGYRRLVLTNLGLSETQRRPVRYSMFIGSDIADQLDALAGNRNRKKTNLFGQGYTEKGKVTIGCSSKGKIWSYEISGSMGEWIDWCREAGGKLLDDTITTDGILRRLVKPRRQDTRPAKPAIGIAWPEGLLMKSEDRVEFEIEQQRVPIYDCDIELIDHATDGPFAFRIGSTERSAVIEMEIDGQGARYRQRQGQSAQIRVGKRTLPIVEYFKEDPPHIYFADGDMLVDSDLFILPRDDGRPPFDLNKIEVLGWKGVDITRESQGVEKRTGTIQRYMIDRMLAAGTHEVLVDDDGSGESADIVGLRLSGTTLLVELVHCKYSSADKAGVRVEDLYEVCGQAQKSIRWRERPDEFLRHLLKREAIRSRAGQPTRLEHGSASTIIGWLNRWQEFSYRFSVTVAQPGLSKAQVKAEHLELLSATETFLMDTWGMPLKVFASA